MSNTNMSSDVLRATDDVSKISDVPESNSVYSFNLFGTEARWYFKKLTILADSSILAKWGGTAVNVSILRGEGDESMEFLPLQVEYLERYYAAGRISDSPYQKREGHPSSEAILKARIIDRAIRPRFNKALRDTVQVYVNVLSYDEEHDPLLLGFNTVVASLMVSSIPFNGPLAGIRISKRDGNLFVNKKASTIWGPTGEKTLEDMDYVLGLEPNGLVMVDAMFNEVNEQDIVDATMLAKQEAESIYKAQQEFANMFKQEKQEGVVVVVPQDFQELLEKEYYVKAVEALGKEVKEERESAIEELENEIKCRFIAENEDCDEQGQDAVYTSSQVALGIEKLFKKAVSKVVLQDNKRIDGRDFDQVRKLSVEVDVLPRTHGSAIFRRGDTMVLTVATLGSLANQLHVEEIAGVEERTYIHEYYAAPYAYGKPGRLKFYPGRREIGHGALAEKALLHLVPDKEKFPYMIRVVTEVVSSSGSTSMAATTGSSLALMDAGVPIKTPATGISIGIIANSDFSNYKLLTDIVDIEDFYGGMDFKVAGTKNGVTAIQMDQKYGYIPYDLVADILEKAKQARLHILDKMLQVIPAPRESLSEYAPQVAVMDIPKNKIGLVIGTGGKVIKDIMEQTSTQINIEEDGKTVISGESAQGLEQAKEMINNIVHEEHGRTSYHDNNLRGQNKQEIKTPTVKVGEIVDIEILEIKPFGAIVKLPDNSTALLHISEISSEYIKNINDVLQVGEVLKAKVIDIDDKGRVKVSIKQV